MTDWDATKKRPFHRHWLAFQHKVQIKLWNRYISFKMSNDFHEFSINQSVRIGLDRIGLKETMMKMMMIHPVIGSRQHYGLLLRIECFQWLNQSVNKSISLKVLIKQENQMSAERERRDGPNNNNNNMIRNR